MNPVNPNHFHGIKVTGPVTGISANKPEKTVPEKSDSADISKEGLNKAASEGSFHMTLEKVLILPEVRTSLLSQISANIESGHYNTPEFNEAFADKLSALI